MDHKIDMEPRKKKKNFMMWKNFLLGLPTVLDYFHNLYTYLQYIDNEKFFFLKYRVKTPLHFWKTLSSQLAMQQTITLWD